LQQYFLNRFTDRVGSLFLGGSEEQFDIVRQYSIAFLEKYVSGNRDDWDVLERKDPLVTRYMIDVLPERDSHKKKDWPSGSRKPHRFRQNMF
jgi:hypothetical protein